MSGRVMFVIFALIQVTGPRAQAMSITERVNCAGALANPSKGGEAREVYTYKGRSVSVSITSRKHYQEPIHSDYIELAMADDRLPTFSTRIKPALRHLAQKTFAWVRRQHVVQLDLAPGEDLDSVKILAFAEKLNVLGYTADSARQREFDVRLGTMQFTSTEFWTSLVSAAKRGQFVSVSAEQGFAKAPNHFLEVTIPQINTWVARAIIVTGLATVANHHFSGTIIPANFSLEASAFLIGVSQVPELASAFAGDLPDTKWMKPIRRLLMFLPNTLGLVNTARLTGVMDQRASVLTQNMVDALDKYPDVFTVQIVTDSPRDSALLSQAVKDRFKAIEVAEIAREEASWTEPDPTFADFPSRLRLKMPNLKHRPTRELVDALKETFSPRQFTSVDEFIAYYRPENLPGWAQGRHSWNYQQIVAMYLFDSMRWSLPQFFDLKPNPEQVRTLLNLPADHFDRGQLHEFPCGNSTLGTVALTAMIARVVFAGDDAKFKAAFEGVRALEAAQWESLVNDLNDEYSISRYLRGYGRGFRPPPKSFSRLPENHLELPLPGPSPEYKFPEDGW